MTRQKDDGRRAFQVMQGQIALLKRGTRAVDYACREVLDLAGDATAVDVKRALHRKIHLLGNHEEAEQEGWLIAYVTAAWVLLKLMAEKR